MNQILVTGFENNNNKNNNKNNMKFEKIPKEKKPRGEKKLLKINTIVMLYSIFIILLGICMISGSVYARNKINETVEANAKPEVSFSQNDEKGSLDIEVTHIRGISSIQYFWNDESEKEEIAGNSRKQIKETIPLIGGSNTLNLEITEDNGNKVSYSNTINAKNIPVVNFEAVSNGVKIIISNEKTINYFSYKWDNGEEEKIEIGEKEYEGILNTPEGKHVLKIEIVDEDDNKFTKEQPVIVDAEPTVKIKADKKDDKIYFVVEAEDDTSISKIEITLNEEIIEQIDDYKEKTYQKEIEMKDGKNQLIVKVYNENDVLKQKGAKFNNE